LTQLTVSTAGHAFAKLSGNTFVPVGTKSDDRIFRYQATRQFMVAVFALVGDTYLQASSEFLVLASLRLRKTLR
jgi:hypothetical protein